MGRRPLPVAVLATLMLALIPPALAQEAADPVGRLVFGAWRGAALGRAVGGSFGLLAGADEASRIEITREAGTPPSVLLGRTGEGWTVILAGGREGVVQPWGERWRTLDGSLAQVAALVAARAAAPAVGTDRVVLETLPRTGRAALTRRGRGRGGPGEILSLVWSRSEGPELKATSSRRPGSLRLTGLRCLDVRYPAREAFVPLWPLSEILEVPVNIPGTCPPPGG